MSCELIRAELDAYLDGELDAERAAEIASHVAGCTSCTQCLAERRAVAQALRSLPRPAAPSGFAQKFRAARMVQVTAGPVSAAPRPARSLWRTPWLVGSAAAAAAALLLAVTLHGTDRRSTPMDAQASRSAAKPSAPAPAAEYRQKTVSGPAGKDSNALAAAGEDALPADRDGRSGDGARRDSDLMADKKFDAAAKRLEFEAEKQAGATARGLLDSPAKDQSAMQAPGPGSRSATPAVPVRPAPPPVQAPRVSEPPRPPMVTAPIAKLEAESEDKRSQSEAREEDVRKMLADKELLAKPGEQAPADGLLSEESLAKKTGPGGLRGDALRHSFALRAEDSESAARQLMRIAEGLGGRELTVSADGKSGGDSWGIRGREADVALGGAAAATSAPAAMPSKPGAPSAPSAAPSPSAGTIAAGAGKAVDQSERRSILLAVPASRLEAFQKALALWSQSGQSGGGGAAEGGKGQEKGSAAGTGAFTLSFAPADLAELRMEKPAESTNGPSLKAAPAQPGRDRQQPEKMVLLIVTFLPEKQ